jgi:cellulose biosynthesis protein BcsQ
MSRVFEALRRAEEKRNLAEPRPHAAREARSAGMWSKLWGSPRAEPPPRHVPAEPSGGAPGSGPARVVTLASLKGGVGKTVIAANLAFYLRDLQPEVPTLLLACDDDPLVDRMFACDENAPRRTVASGEPVIRGGRYGVSTLRPMPRSWGLASAPEPDSEVGHLLGATDWDGLVVVDTPPDFGARTRGALAASDVVLIPVSDRASLDKAAQLFELMDEHGLARDRVHLLLSQLDLRIKYREGESRDVLALLVSEIRRQGWPLLGAFLSRTPKVASLYTNEAGPPLPVAVAAPGSVVHRQFRHLADDVLRLLAQAPASLIARRAA